MKHLLSIVGYIFGTLLVQATSHFAVFKAHYDAVAYNRPDPSFALGVSSMIIQGAVLSYVYSKSDFKSREIGGALTLSWLFGAFLVSYEALAEAAKYVKPDIMSWIGVEVLTGAIQFTLIGLLLFAAHHLWRSQANATRM
jgi:hypothetical protein